MTLNELKNTLQSLESIEVFLPDGTRVPPHFHLTELGRIDKHFMDCGGVERRETTVQLQLWTAEDTEHRLAPAKMLAIVEKAQERLGLGDWPVEVEYQGETIGRYGLAFAHGRSELVATATDCLAKELCGVPPKRKLAMAELGAQEGGGCCTPSSGCC